MAYHRAAGRSNRIKTPEDRRKMTKRHQLRKRVERLGEKIKLAKEAWRQAVKRHSRVTADEFMGRFHSLMLDYAKDKAKQGPDLTPAIIQKTADAMEKAIISRTKGLAMPAHKALSLFDNVAGIIINERVMVDNEAKRSPAILDECKKAIELERSALWKWLDHYLE